MGQTKSAFLDENKRQRGDEYEDMVHKRPRFQPLETPQPTNKRRGRDEDENTTHKRQKVEPLNALKRKIANTNEERSRPSAPKQTDEESMLEGFQKLGINNYMKESDKLSKDVVNVVTRMDTALIDQCQRKGGVASLQCPVDKPHVEMMGNLKCCLPLPDDRAMMYMQSFIKHCIQVN